MSVFAAVGFSPIAALTERVLIPPPASAIDDDIAIIWIHGALCDPAAYKSFITEIQNQMSDAEK